MHTTSKRIASICILVVLLLALYPLEANAEAQQSADEIQTLHLPATGDCAFLNSSGAIDISNIDQGYVMCRYTGPSNRALVQATKTGSSNTYTYRINSNKEYEAIPLTQGDGFYHIQIWSGLQESQYSQVISAKVEVKLADAFLPFLYASRQVSFDTDSKSVAKGLALTEDTQDDAGKIAAVYQYVVEHISYDYEKASDPEAWYTGRPDVTLRTGRGICVDYAVLAAAMLRSQGIPCKVVYGWTPEDKYHAWISAYSTAAGETHDGVIIKPGSWNLFDPTFAAGVPEYIDKHFKSDRGKYIAQYEY